MWVANAKFGPLAVRFTAPFFQGRRQEFGRPKLIQLIILIQFLINSIFFLQGFEECPSQAKGSAAATSTRR